MTLPHITMPLRYFTLPNVTKPIRDNAKHHATIPLLYKALQYLYWHNETLLYRCNTQLSITSTMQNFALRNQNDRPTTHYFTLKTVIYFWLSNIDWMASGYWCCHRHIPPCSCLFYPGMVPSIVIWATLRIVVSYHIAVLLSTSRPIPEALQFRQIL